LAYQRLVEIGNYVAASRKCAKGSNGEFDCVTASSDLARVAAGFVDFVTIAEVIDG